MKKDEVQIHSVWHSSLWIAFENHSEQSSVRLCHTVNLKIASGKNSVGIRINFHGKNLDPTKTRFKYKRDEQIWREVESFFRDLEKRSGFSVFPDRIGFLREKTSLPRTWPIDRSDGLRTVGGGGEERKTPVGAKSTPEPRDFRTRSKRDNRPAEVAPPPVRWSSEGVRDEHTSPTDYSRAFTFVAVEWQLLLLSYVARTRKRAHLP